MSIEFLDVEQNSPEWRRARMGIPTASSFDDVMTPGKTKSEQKTRRTYMLKLAGEILTGQPMEHVMTAAMERGHMMEAEARDLYAFQSEDGELKRTGFVRNGRAGCSPDSLIGDDGGLEIKTKAPHLLIDVILKDEFPAEHLAQVQGTLWVTGRKWWDLAVYWPGLPLFVKRVFRDEAYIQNLAAEIARFTADLDEVVSTINARVAESLPEWIALRDLTPSPELLATRIVQEGALDTTTLADNGMPAFLDRRKKALQPTPAEAEWHDSLVNAFDACADALSFGSKEIPRPA